MFSKMKMTSSTDSFSQSVRKLRHALDACDCVVSGAGAGLSASAGFTYSGERFERYFADFEKKYGFRDMYSGGFYPYKTPEEYWAFWSRNILVNRYMDAPGRVYDELLSLVRDKDYFVLTTNVDHCFQKAGFDRKRLFYTQGDYGLFQCSEPCHMQTYDNAETIRQMCDEQADMRVPSARIPHCPRCGRPMTTNLRVDNRFVQDEGWHQAAQRYADFLRTRESQKMLLLELGVGYNTPGIIKIPFWEMTAKNPQATYACINFSDASFPAAIQPQSIGIAADIGETLHRLCAQ